MTLNKREADLNIFPNVINHAHTHISIGDLHGNTLKLIYTLIEEGVLKLTQNDYNQLRDIYNTPVKQLTSQQIRRFETIIANAEVSKNTAVTLIGDELADRGNNDYFTLLLLNKLSKTVDMDIMISNHSMEFIHDYEQPEFTGRHRLGPQGQSLTNMRTLIDAGLIQEDKVRDMVESGYIPMVKAIGYTVSLDGQVTLFSHAPIGLETVEGLAKKLDIPYRDSNIRELLTTIDAINEIIKEQFENKELANIFNAEDVRNPNLPISPNKPLNRLVWNRALGDELRTVTSSGIKIKFVHGHIGPGEILKNKTESLQDSHQNLDNLFGKGPELFKTNRDSIFNYERVEHFTRQSSDLTEKQLKNDRLDVLVEMIFKANLASLEKITGQLSNTAKTDPKYAGVDKAGKKLINELNAAGKTFFNKTITQESYNEFSKRSVKAFEEAHQEFGKHRDYWHEVHPICKGILGVILFIPIFYPVTFAIHYASHKGFIETFFGDPKTRSVEDLQSVGTKLFKQMKDELEGLKKAEEPNGSLEEPQRNLLDNSG